MTQPTRYDVAFQATITSYQQLRHNEYLGLKALNYTSVIGHGAATNVQCSAIVRPLVSDFLADVELTARRKLHGKHQRFFFDFYRDQDGQHDEVKPEESDVDRHVRRCLGRAFIDLGLFPITRYLAPVDTRDRKAGSANSSDAEEDGGARVVQLNASATPFLDAKEAAAFLGGLNPRTVSRWAREGYLPASPIGEGKKRLWRFTEADLTAWMEARRQGGQLAA